jgi:hypothetical protein
LEDGWRPGTPRTSRCRSSCASTGREATSLGEPGFRSATSTISGLLDPRRPVRDRSRLDQLLPGAAGSLGDRHLLEAVAECVAARFVPYQNPVLGVFAVETGGYTALTECSGGGWFGIHGSGRRDRSQLVVAAARGRARFRAASGASSGPRQFGIDRPAPRAVGRDGGSADRGLCR